ncbi:unnamed protein product, partial [Rotaria sp. Silwood1]
MKVIRDLQEAEKEEEEATRLRLRSASQILPTNTSHKKQIVSTWSTSCAINEIQPEAPISIPGRSAVHLTEEADDEIRFQFHILLEEKIYPTTAILLERLLGAHTDFPVRSQTTLRRHMH